MDIKTFKGNFFEIGVQQGKIYKQNRMSFDKVRIDSRLYTSQLKAYRKYYPQILEEFEGMALGGEYNKDKLIYSFITEELRMFRRRIGLNKACTIFGIKKGSTLYVGRNYDWHPAAEKVSAMYRVINSKANSFVAISDMGIMDLSSAKPPYLFYYPDDAINDKGLFVGLTFALADKWAYGLSSLHIMKLITETCATVNDALQVFAKISACCPKNYFIADKTGNMAVIEHAARKYAIVNPTDGVLIQTNHYVDAKLAKEDTVLQTWPTHNTFIRYYETLQKINEKKPNFTFEDIIKILGQPGTYTCQNSADVKTIWTLALNMTKKEYRLYWDDAGKRRSRKVII